jgi:hypothetical protein
VLLSYRLCKVEAENSLKGAKLEENAVLLQQLLILPVKSERANNSDYGTPCIEYSDPDMGKVHTVGLLAECASS